LHVLRAGGVFVSVDILIESLLGSVVVSA
jgi:hypothetical protein